MATCFGMLVFSGMALMTSYAPSRETAWASVHFIQFVAPHGWVVRGVHFWAAQGFIVFSAAHVAHGARTRRYRAPREVAWWLTLAVSGLAVVEGITGGLLPWDQRGWWARSVEGEILGLAPLVGSWMKEMMFGGPELGSLGLTRAYTLHVAMLPAWLTAALLLRRRMGPRDVRPAVVGRDPPGAASHDLVTYAAAVVMVALTLTECSRGAPLDAPADPLRDYPARPEWYLLGFYQVGAFLHGVAEFWAVALVSVLAGAFLALLPWIDRASRRRPPVTALTVCVFTVYLGLCLGAWAHDRHEAGYLRARRKADARALRAAELAMKGVPPEGPLEMVRLDPQLRGRDLFDRHCAGCHVLGDSGDAEGGTAPKLDGWGTPEWIEAMLHNPDAPELFGRGPYRGKMPSADTPPKLKDFGRIPLVRNPAEMRAVALFLSAQGEEAGDPLRAADPSMLALGEQIVRERCTTCHLYEGVGDEGFTRTAPELWRYGSVAWTLAQIRNPATAKTYRDKALSESLKRHMPRFDTELSPSDLELLARWTRAHGRGLDRL